MAFRNFKTARTALLEAFKERDTHWTVHDVGVGGKPAKQPRIAWREGEHEGPLSLELRLNTLVAGRRHDRNSWSRQRLPIDMRKIKPAEYIKELEAWGDSGEFS